MSTIVYSFLRLFKKQQSETGEKAMLISRIRRELLFWGYDTSDLTDEDIEKGVKAFSQACLSMGFSVQEAEHAFKILVVESINHKYQGPSIDELKRLSSTEL